MIEKIAVRKMLTTYEHKIKIELKGIEEETKRIKSAFTTNEAQEIWLRSKECAELKVKWETLHKVLFDIIDLRCDETLED